MKKRVLIPLLLACLLAALLPAAALAATANNIAYYDWSDSEKKLVPKTCSAATVVSSNDTTWGDDGNGGWYVVNSNVTINSRITVTGEVHLILMDGCTLTAQKGIRVQDNDDDCTNGSPNALTIYGQAGGKGGLTVPKLERFSKDAAIGGTSGVTGACGTVTINGGVINVKGEFGAGIGGYADYSLEYGKYKAGGAGGRITINGGTVTATSGWGAGIGGGRGDHTRYGGIITINGGTVTASSSYGASIGGGQLVANHQDQCDSGADVTISGGIVFATGYSGRSIGSGQNTTGNGIVNPGTFNTTANGNAVIFADSIHDQSDKANWHGVIFEGNTGEVYGGTVTPCGGFTIDSGKTLTIDSGNTLVNSHIIHVKGTVVNNGTVTNTGKIYVDGTFTGTADNLYYPLTVRNATASNNLSDYNSKTYGKAGSAITLTPSTPPQQGMELSGWDVEPETVQVSNNSFTMPKSVVSIAARFGSISYTVRFNTDGGSTIADKTVYWDDAVLGDVVHPTKTGWTFTGWTCGDTPVSAQTKYSELASSDSVKSITLTAQWKDAIAPVISGIENGKVYCAAQTVTVTDNVGVTSVTVNNTPVTPDSNGTFTLTATNSAQTIVVKDAAGNETQMTVTVNDGHRGGTATCVDQAVCMYCGTAYGDKDAENHVDLGHEPAKDATVTDTGNIEYWYCSGCKQYYADANGIEAITQEQTITQKLPPEIIEGMGQSILVGEKKALSFTSNAAFDDFKRVELDGKPLSAEYYTAKAGSTVVTLKAGYVATLAVGEHTIGIVSESGTAETAFSVNPELPQTGDGSHMLLWMTLLLVSGGLLTAVFMRKRSAR